VIASGSTETPEASCVSVAIVSKVASDSAAELDSAGLLEPGTLVRTPGAGAADRADRGFDDALCDAAAVPGVVETWLSFVNVAAVPAAASASAVVDFDAAVSDAAEEVPTVDPSGGEDDLEAVVSGVPRAAGVKTSTSPVGGTRG
jgi:hypothetical protein